MDTEKEYLKNRDKLFPIELRYKVLLEMVAEEYETSVEGVEAHIITCIIENRFQIMELVESKIKDGKLNG